MSDLELNKKQIAFENASRTNVAEREALARWIVSLADKPRSRCARHSSWRSLVVVFGAGGAFMGILYEELTGKKLNTKTSYQIIEAERIDKPHN